jgi:cation diffusion facilitator family transporter
MAEPKIDPNIEVVKSRAASLSLGYNVVLTLIKGLAAFLTGSVSLLSEAVHSGTDVAASLVALLSVRAASVPADEDHPYGHGKIESLTGLFEAILLLAIVCYILYEAVHRLTIRHSLTNIETGLWVMGVSALSSFLAGRYVSMVGERTSSIALRSNGQHLMVDFWTSVGVFSALAVTRLTGWVQADSWFAIVLAGWIAWGAFGMSREAINVLVDRRMPDEDVAKVEAILHDAPGCLSFHQLRTRSSGSVRYVEAHIVVPNDWSVVQAHDLADRLEKQLQIALNPAYVVLHVDPYDSAKATMVENT